MFSLVRIISCVSAGKTSVLLRLSAQVAENQKIAGREVSPGRVIYLAGENPDDIRMRWMAMAQRMPFDPDKINVHFIPGRFTLSTMFDRVADEVRDLGGAVLLIFDTAAVYFEGEDDNSNAQMGEYARTLRRFTTLAGGPCVIVACHPTKNATDDRLLPRGGGAFLNEMDGNLVCWQTDGLVQVHWHEKHRGADFSPIPFKLHTVTASGLVDSKGRPIPTVLAEALSEKAQEAAEAETRSDEDAVLVLLLHGGGSSNSKMAEALGWFMRDGKAYKEKVRRVSERLKKSKLVTDDRNGACLTEKGKKEAAKCA